MKQISKLPKEPFPKWEKVLIYLLKKHKKLKTLLFHYLLKNTDLLSAGNRFASQTHD